MALDDIVFNAFGSAISGGAYWSALAGGGGSGIWTAAGTTWATGADGVGSGQAQGSGNLIFANTAGTVTVSGGVTVTNGMAFQTTGYTVESSTITLGGATSANNTVTTDGGVTTTISSELAGTTGMTKAGVGTLILSSSNSLSGNITISAGTLQIDNESALGNSANDLANNGTLKTTSSISLGSDRDVTGSGTFDIANATTLTVNGSFSNTATTLASSGTLSLQGSTRNVGNLTLNAAATVNAAGAINVTGLTASGLTSGTATINPDIIFTSGDKTVNVAGGTLDLNGVLSGNTNRILKTGAGTLILSGSNNLGGLRIGAAGATPTDGGTVILETSAVGTQAQAIQHNFGTLQAASALVITNGLSIGGRTNGAATMAGADMEFQGQSAFFRGTGTSGELVLNVNNKTTLSGGLAVTSGGGTATGVTVGGSGTLIVSGDSSLFTDRITTANTVKLFVNGTLGATDISVSANTVLGGVGTLQAVTLNGGTIAPGNSPGTLSMASLDGSNGTFLFEIGAPTTTFDAINVTNGLTFGSNTQFDFAKLDSYAFQSGDTYDLFNWGTLVTGSQDAAILQNLQTALNSDFALSGDLSWDVNSFLTSGTIAVIPEPSSQLLLALGLAGLAGLRASRRKNS